MRAAQPFETGKVTISLDTELGWGRIDSGRFEDIDDCLDRAKSAIERLISLFEKHSIPATWAFVGQLFRPEPVDENANNPVSLPTSWDNLPTDHDWWRSPDLIEDITTSPVEHEIASHSGTHVPYSDLSSEEAVTDVEAFQAWSDPFVTDVSSFVFPQNRIAHLDVLRRTGFQCYRGRPPLLGSDPSPTAFLPRLERGLVNVPASVAYRQYDGRIPLLANLPNGAKIAGMKAAVRHAAMRGRVCHVVLHPKDFAHRGGTELLSGFDRWLDYVATKRDEGRVEVSTMGEIADEANFPEKE